ncbi:hypothetical protein CLV51_103155 [Chitinophaga niastensis]|uniref:Uncharacterized protein n=1 Tax=Chitinophaga niastensis TaxID=536980 RepID=A0A2P8HIY3_CHINA|nr:hypothetical protein CLV51_103155 [Chitinophaga niastensis]
MFKQNYKKSSHIYLIIEIMLYCLITVAIIGLLLL